MNPSDESIDWSYTNAMYYESCPRSLFYHYWHHRQNYERNAQKNKEHYNMRYSSLGSIIGTAVHRGISTQMTRWGRGDSTSRCKVHKRAINSIEQASRPTSITTDEQTDWRSSPIETTIDHLDRFLSVIWPQIRTRRYILHERLDSTKVDETTVWVKPDLCQRDSDGDLILTDWKTRQPELFEGLTLQLRTYALWAQQEFEPDVDRIKLQLGFTSTGDMKEYPVSKIDLETTRDRIRSDTELWQCPSQKSAFPTDPAAEKCSSCPYLSECSVGQTTVDEY